MEDWKLQKTKALKWHFGEDAPTNEVGVDGDLYFNAKNRTILRRLEDKWELAADLIGAKGEDGYNPLTVSEVEPSNAIQGDLWYNDGLFVMHNGSWKEIVGSDGEDGQDGRDIEVRVKNSVFQWAYTGSDLWVDLFDLNALKQKGDRGPRGFRGERGPRGKKGEDAKEIELRVYGSKIQWRRVGERWKDLISINKLSGTTSGGGGGGGITITGVTEIIAGTNITVDSSNPQKPIVSATGGGGAVDSVNGQTGVVVLDAGDVSADPAGSASTAESNANQYTDDEIAALTFLESVQAGDNMNVDNTDPQNPIISADILNGFEQQNEELTATYAYVGYKHIDDRWFIYRRTRSGNIRLYASGASDYATNWTGRAGLSYS